MLTFFSIPKPFTGIDDLHQKNAINSWKKLVSGNNVVLLGDSEIEAAAQKLGVRSATGLKTNHRGTPLVNSAFELVRDASDSPYFAFVNCDMILFEEFISAFNLLSRQTELKRFFATTRRVDLPVNRLVDFQIETDISRLKHDAQTNGVVESLVCKDVMLFPRNLFDSIPDFAVGRGNWDNWMVYRAKQLGVPVIRMTTDILTIHQAHDYSEKVSNSRLSCYVTSEEARENQRLAGGRHLIRGSTCDYELNCKGLLASRFKWMHGEFWRDFPRFSGLLMQLIGFGRRI